MRRILLSENELAVIADAMISFDAPLNKRKYWETALKEIVRTMHDETMLVDPLTGDFIHKEKYS